VVEKVVLSMMNVLLDTNFRHVDDIFLPEDLARVRTLGEIMWGKDEPIPEESLATLKDSIDVIVTGGWRYGSVKTLPKLRAILDVGGRHPGPEEISYPDCAARGIRVLTCSPAFAPMVAEMALGMAISAAREIVTGDRAMRDGSEKYVRFGNQTTFSLFGKRIGFVGYGAIARQLRELLAPFRCEISVYDPWLPKTFLKREGVRPVDLPTVMATSDVTFVLAIPTNENRGMLTAELLRQIPPGAVLALISRAHIVDFEALTELVLEGRFKAAIDVFPTEPLTADHPIRSAPMAVLSAHRAGSVLGELKRIGQMVADDLEAVGNGIPPREMLRAEPEYIRQLTKTW
jgi:phosphoglycerate dehydrogenase-like enzyme